MIFKFKPEGVCVKEITLDLDDMTGSVNSVNFLGGCNGNLNCIGNMMKDKHYTTYNEYFNGNTCGKRSTSCMDQLSKMLNLVWEHYNRGVEYPYEHYSS